MRKDFGDRIFRIWDYVVSHDQLLIRSYDKEKGNIDLLFYGVEYFNCPTIFRGLIIDNFNNEDKKIVSSMNVKIKDFMRMHVLVTMGRRYFIISTENIITYKNDFEPLETSIDTNRVSLGITGEKEII